MKTIRSLEAIGQDPNAGDTLLIQLLLTKLEKSLKEDWQEESIDISLPTMKHFTEFKSLHTNFNKKLDFLILPTITQDLPIETIDRNIIDVLKKHKISRHNIPKKKQN